jgi:hypothetical protein
MTAARADISVATQGCRAATQNGPKGFELLKTKAGSIVIQEVIALPA